MWTELGDRRLNGCAKNKGVNSLTEFSMQLTAAFLVRTVLAVVVAVAHHRLRDALPVCAEIETMYAKGSKLKPSENGKYCH